MNNKPKYNLFKNTQYAIDGFVHAFKTESSFKLELLASIFIIPIIFLIDMELSSRLILIATAFLFLLLNY